MCQITTALWWHKSIHIFVEPDQKIVVQKCCSEVYLFAIDDELGFRGSINGFWEENEKSAGMTSEGFEK